MITIERISKQYGNIMALNNVSLTVPKGQVLGLLGQNGAGKSTLLNIMSGYTLATKGDISINSVSMMENPVKAKSFLGFLPEHPPLYTEMSVREYLLFCIKLKGVVDHDRSEHIKEIIMMTGLKPVENRIIAHLSKGYQQRVGLAQALCGSPDVLLLDEPSSGFDPGQMIEFRGIIRSLANKHTIILSSHILSEVDSICERIIIIHRGEIAYDHVKDDTIQQKQFYVRIAGKSNNLLPGLRSLPSVIKVKPVLLHELFEANIYTHPELSFQTELFQFLSALGTPIFELRPVYDNLEDIFMNITASDHQDEV